jgi:hypothetical protein
MLECMNVLKYKYINVRRLDCMNVKICESRDVSLLSLSFLTPSPLIPPPHSTHKVNFDGIMGRNK